MSKTTKIDTDTLGCGGTIRKNLRTRTIKLKKAFEAINLYTQAYSPTISYGCASQAERNEVKRLERECVHSLRVLDDPLANLIADRINLERHPHNIGRLVDSLFTRWRQKKMKIIPHLQ